MYGMNEWKNVRNSNPHHRSYTHLSNHQARLGLAWEWSLATSALSSLGDQRANTSKQVAIRAVLPRVGVRKVGLHRFQSQLKPSRYVAVFNLQWSWCISCSTGTWSASSCTVRMSTQLGLRGWWFRWLRWKSAELTHTHTRPSVVPVSREASVESARSLHTAVSAAVSQVK
jgi:hypothetical protein